MPEDFHGVATIVQHSEWRFSETLRYFLCPYITEHNEKKTDLSRMNKMHLAGNKFTYMRRKSLCLLLSIATCRLVAQHETEWKYLEKTPVYIVLNNGDTLHGYTNDGRYRDRLPKYASLSKEAGLITDDGIEHQFKPKEIKMVVVTISRWMKADSSDMITYTWVHVSKYFKKNRYMFFVLEPFIKDNKIQLGPIPVLNQYEPDTSTGQPGDRLHGQPHYFIMPGDSVVHPYATILNIFPNKAKEKFEKQFAAYPALVALFNSGKTAHDALLKYNRDEMAEIQAQPLYYSKRYFRNPSVR